MNVGPHYRDDSSSDVSHSAPSGDKKPILIAVGALGIIVLGLVSLPHGSTQSQSRAETQTAITVDPVIGTTALIGKDGDGSICAATRDKLRAAESATEIGDQDGFAEAMIGGASFDGGDRVLVIDNAMGSGVQTGIDVRVRILTGANAHLACWAWQAAMHLRPAH